MGAILNFSEGKLGNIDIRYYSYLLHYTMFASSLRKTRDVTIISNDILTKWQKALHNCRWRCYESFETQINNVCFWFFIIKFLCVFPTLIPKIWIRKKRYKATCNALLSRMFILSRYISSVLYRCRFVTLSGTHKFNFLYLAYYQGLREEA